MKKKIAILSIFMIAMLLLTCNVFATETFDYEGTTYVIDEVKLKISSLGDEIDFLGKDENNNYIFHDYMNEIMYKVNEKECTAMSSQEILDFMNNKYDIYYFAQDDLNIYQEKFKALGLSDQGKFITEDKTVDSNKIYFKRTENQEGDNLSISYETVNNPDLENGIYYEEAFFNIPQSAEIDETISYYQYDMSTNTYIKVENPKEDDAHKYVIIGEAEEIETKKIGQLSQEVYDKIFLKESSSMYTVFDEENNEIYFLMNYEDSKKSGIYKADGTIIKEFTELMAIEPLGKEFFIVAPRNEHWIIDSSVITIIDKKGNTVLESENLPFLEEVEKDGATTYLKNYEYIINEFYNMYEYKLISVDNQKYEGKDLQVKTSGELDRLTSVKVNGVELDASNYTKTSGSTIVTLKNDYLKTLEKGTYNLEIEYIDGVTIKTAFIIENDPVKNNTNTGSGTTGESENSSGLGEAIPEPNQGEKDDTPKTGNTTEQNNIAMYVMIVSVIVGAIVSRLKIKE